MTPYLETRRMSSVVAFGFKYLRYTSYENSEETAMASGDEAKTAEDRQL